jgi:small ligand-binding sensory domain FIST
MQWINALSTRPSLEAAIDDVIRQTASVGQAGADLAIVFISSAFASEYSRLMLLLQERLPEVPMVGCCGGGVIGMGWQEHAEEIEGKPALSLTLAILPEVSVQAFHLDADRLPDLDSAPTAWSDLVGIDPAQKPQFILLADPSGHVNDLLQGLDFAYPNAPKVGGLASTTFPGNISSLFCNYETYHDGVVGVALSGRVVLDTIVAQGCRPIGDPYRVVEGERNIVLALEEPTLRSSSYGGTRVSQKRTPLEILQELIQDLDEDDRQLAQHSLFVGIAQSEFKQTLEQGDFLIRNLIGVDPRVGAIAIGDRIRLGQRIQFHLRDARASMDDLAALLTRHRSQMPEGARPVGALMFACLGRGEGLYGAPNFDSKLFSQYLAHVPLSGFFCNGEIGPVGSTTFLHGYTSVFGIVRQL